MKIILVAGARPNFVKVAPVLRALSRYEDIQALLVHTGQHYDPKMSGEIFRDLQLPEPHENLGVGSGSHAEQTAKVMLAFEQVCLRERPDWVTVVGDVNSTLACALASKKLNIRVAHVEAGLRSRDMSMPEEINRICTDAISDLLFTTEAGAGENLQAEGVESSRIHFVGNVMIDTLYRHLERSKSLPLPEPVTEGRYGVVTLHRPANVDDRATMEALMDVFARIARRVPLVFPMHPRTRGRLRDFGIAPSAFGALVIEPLSYLPFLGLVARSRFVLTDSGGIQEETTALGVPCLTLRNNTERPVTCEIGTNVLVGLDPTRILNAAFAVLDGRARKGRVPPFWDGRAADRIAAVLARQQAPRTWGGLQAAAGLQPGTGEPQQLLEETSK